MPRMPDHVQRQRRAGHGRLGAGQAAQHGGLQQGGRGGQQVAAVDESGQTGKTGHHHRKAPLHAVPGQPLVYIQRPARLIDHGDVARRQIVGHALRRGAHGRVVKHAVARLEQALLHDVAALG